MNIILMGLPGAGKELKQKLSRNSQYISTGDMFRKAIKRRN